MKDDGSGSTAGGTADEGAEFNAYYFEHCCGRPYKRDDHWLRFFGRIADRIVEEIHPRRALDAGCAMGFLVEALRAREVEADGVDISSYAIENVPEPIRPFCRVGSIAEELPERYDLIVSIEVLEHMPPADGEAAIANFCRHTDDVLFSSTPGDYREPTHVNVQPPEYWAEQFARHGFFRDVDFDASFVTSWAVRFRRMHEPLPRIVRNYERRFAALSAERNDRRQYAADLQSQLADALEQVRAIEEERHELAAVRAALEATHANLTDKVVELDAALAREAAARADLDRRSHELTHARSTISMMQQSFFWRLRTWLGRR